MSLLACPPSCKSTKMRQTKSFAHHFFELFLPLYVCWTPGHRNWALPTSAAHAPAAIMPTTAAMTLITTMGLPSWECPGHCGTLPIDDVAFPLKLGISHCQLHNQRLLRSKAQSGINFELLGTISGNLAPKIKSCPNNFPLFWTCLI